MSKNTTENWRPIPGAIGLYEASDMGRIRSVDRHVTNRVGITRLLRGRVRKLRLGNAGYLLVTLPAPIQASRLVHRLVALAFLGEPPDGHTVNHKNGVKTDNRASNLEYLSMGDNVRAAWDSKPWRPGHHPGESNGSAKITEAQARHILAMRGKRRQKDLAADFGISEVMVSLIHRRLAWKHLE